MNILVVDDESLARERLISLIEELDDKKQFNIQQAENGQVALVLCQQNVFDLLLLDIRMPEIDGMSLAQQLNQQPQKPLFIFVSAYGEYAVDAFGVDAVDYLLKPVRKARLLTALQKALKKHAKKNQVQFINIHYRGELKKINIEQINYFKAEQKYVIIDTPDQQYLLEESLKSLEQRFSQNYIRIHRNALISKTKLRGIKKNEAGHSCAVLKDCNELLEISRRHLPLLRKFLKQ